MDDMIDGIRRRRQDSDLHPRDQHLAHKIVVGDHTDSHTDATRPHFRSPEEVAAAEETDGQPGAASPLNEGNSTAHGADDVPPHAGSHYVPPDEKPQRRSLKERLQALDKKQWLIVGGIAAIIIIGSAVGAYFIFHKNKSAAQTHTVSKSAVTPQAQPTTVPSTLTGLPVDPLVNQRTLTGVMIENSTDARPQSGLDQAGVVFEAVAEGGITRFLALFQDTQPTYLGPVRSVRPYYISWAMGFDAAIAHVGGSPEALQDMKNLHVKDLDQFANGSFYHRITSRYAPHNVYTSIGSLNQLEIQKGFGAAHYTGFARKAESPSKAPQATSIDFTVSSSYFNVHYNYDPTTNSYKRFEGGQPHMEVDETGATKQISPKVVLALVMPQGIEADDLHTSYGTLGSGHMFVFQDGNVAEGTWKKDSNTSQFVFTKTTGETIDLNPGQTWITIVNDPSHVSYKP